MEVKWRRLVSYCLLSSRGGGRDLFDLGCDAERKRCREFRRRLSARVDA
jgi:hypothetical protein